MFRKLRWKFVWLSSIILCFVIILVSAAVWWTSSHTILSQTVFLMEEIWDNDGDLPWSWDADFEHRPYLALNEESIYETRYYTAVYDGEELVLGDMNIAIKEKEAQRIAEIVLNKKTSYGTIRPEGKRTLNYLKGEKEDGSTFIVILDCTSRYALIRLVMMYLAALWFAVVVLYIIIMGKFSGRLVQPFIDNDEKQKRFITNASHELKTPLAVISSNTEMTEAMGGKTKWTESTTRQVKKMQSLIEDLVVLSRLDEMQELALSKTELSALCADTVEPFRGVIEESGRRLLCRIDAGVSAMTEKRSFQQLVTILMDNAAKYCDKDGEIEVELHSRNRGRGARLTVANTYAEGKDKDYSRFFERFYREDVSHNSKVAGFGIGLSMAKEIAERLKGELLVEYAGDKIRFLLEL
ncbi:MAG: HAMP domain-containing histidine kinase [Lachnospiraceae bacterium]|nr:HAMP domain-containing histidine kinase [Lachnospiraceae bacterium]